MAVAPGTIDFMKDTLYRIGGMDPEGFYSQSQLNNNMSGNDANAIYYATHDQRGRRTYNDQKPGYDYNEGQYQPFDLSGTMNLPYDPSTYGFYDDSNGAGAQRQDYLRSQGLKPDTGRQTASPMDDYNAYVTGADSFYPIGVDDVLPQGIGSFEGIPRELLSNKDPVGEYYAALLQQMVNQGLNPEVV